MSGSENPFEDKGEPNPFEDPSVQATGGSGGDGFDANPYEQPAASAPPEQAASASASPAKPSGGAYDAAPAPSSTYGAYDTGAYAASSTNAYASSPTPAYNAPSASDSADAALRARELDERERALERREADVARREATVGAGGKEKNYPFPGFFVFDHHDIDGEIPEVARASVKMAHYSFIALTVSLFYNFFFASAAAMFEFGAVTGWMMAAVYLLCGVPGAYYLWYRRIYSACKRDSALTYMWFFLVYLFHLGFCFYAVIGMTQTEYSLCGISNMSKAMKENGAVGGVFVFGMCLFIVTMGLSVNAVRMVYATFRGTGHTLQEAKNEMAREGVRGAANAHAGSRV